MHIEELLPGVNIENKNIEFKGIIEVGADKDGKPKEDGWLKTVVAFANTDGGDLIIGVNDKSHQVMALDHHTADKTALMIQRLIAQKISPSISFAITEIPLHDSAVTRYVLKVSVAKSRNLPVYLHDRGMMGIYLRTFGKTNLATPEEIRDLILLSDEVRFDSVWTDALFKEDDFKKLYALYRENTGSELSEKTLFTAGFINDSLHLSAGALLFSDSYNGLRTKVVATLWPQTDKGSSYILASEECTGNILDSISFMTSFVRNHSVTGFKKEIDRRSDYFSYPERSVIEGIVNAVAHRNYYMAGTQIEINMFIDRLEITSPGSLLGVRRLEKEKNIAAIMPKRRNDVITKILELVRLMESKGSGFSKIADDYKDNGDAFSPYISSEGDHFTLTLPNLTFRQGVLGSSNIPAIRTVMELKGKHDSKILSFCFNGWKTAGEILGYLGAKDSTWFRKEVIGRLVDEGYLRKSNNGKVSTYKTNQEMVFLEDR